MKNIQGRHKGISMLMISSQLILAAFLAFWISKEFKAEKQVLKKELNTEYEMVFNQQIDTLILEELITPTLNDSTFHKFFIKSKHPDSLLHDSTKFDIIIEKNLSDGTNQKSDSIKIFTFNNSQNNFRLSQEVDLSNINPDSIMSISITKDEMMVKSVKMFISHTDESLKNNEFHSTFTFPVDSSQLIRELDKLSNKQNRKLKFIWNPENTDQNQFIELNILTEKTLDLFATNYSLYITKQLLPEILFAIFLLLLSGTALFLAWKSLKQQLRLNTLRNDFMANISHELKTPVATVKIALEAIRKYNLKKDTAATEEYLSMAAKETTRLENLLEKVMEHAAIDNSAMSLNMELSNIQELCTAVISNMQTQIKEAQTRINIEHLPETLLCKIDKVYIETVIRNLIDNAIKYSPVPAEINISFHQKDQKLFLNISDKGPGIPEEYLSQVFDKFFRVPGGDRHDVKGHGLGLHLAKQVMLNHNGTIQVKNNPDKGCTFALTFLKCHSEN